MMCRVVNIRHEPYDIYCGRAGNGLKDTFGNPHPVGHCKLCKTEHRRGEAIKAFELDFISSSEWAVAYRQKIKEQIRPEHTLGCFCKQPKVFVNCHCDVIADFVDNYDYDIDKYRQSYWCGLCNRFKCGFEGSCPCR